VQRQNNLNSVTIDLYTVDL